MVCQEKRRDLSIEQKGFIPQYKLVTSSATPESSPDSSAGFTGRRVTPSAAKRPASSQPRGRNPPPHSAARLYIVNTVAKAPTQLSRDQAIEVNSDKKIIAQINKPILQKKQKKQKTRIIILRCRY